MLGVRIFGLSRSSMLMKRAFDVAVADVAVVLLVPLLAAIALVVKLTSPGPAIFRRPRVGRDGQLFNMFKLRTMVDGAEAQRDRPMQLNETGGLFKMTDDPRVTRVGRWMRRSSLDELPPLINVAHGEMSLV